MIYLFAGEDAKKKMSSVELCIESLSKDTEIFTFSKNDFEPSVIENFYSGQGLFFKKCIILVRGALEKEENEKFILDNLEAMSVSQNFFIFLEGKLKKATVDAFRKAKAEVSIFDLTSAEKEKFNSFLLANAFGLKSKLELWIYFRQAIEKGVSLEELVGVLQWKAKDMILKKNFSLFSEKDLRRISMHLAYILPEARGSARDDEAHLERFLLEAF
jgi:hypothetical protein